jgi:hypothetical protein
MKRVAQRVPLSQIRLLFADTIIEDQDCYRLVIEGAANIFQLPRPKELIERAMALPEISIDDPHCLRRKIELDALRLDTAEVIPGLAWICEGRHPWEVFEDRGFIGNSQHDPCSLHLKRNLLNDWVMLGRKPDEVICYVGIDWTEAHRINGRPGKPGLRERMLPWVYEAPMCERPLLSKQQMLDWLAAEGIEPPRLYALGYPHNNCGGYCCKGGQTHFAHRLKVHPERYAFDEWWENRIRAKVGNYSMLTDRSGDGLKKPLTLTMLRERIEAKECFDETEWGGCGCAV